ncbi:MAG: OmpA family protein [Myxococcota bacterium]
MKHAIRAAGVLALLVVAVEPAAAQVRDNRVEGRAVAADRFSPNRMSNSILDVRGALSLPHLELNSALYVGYLSRPVDNYITPETDHIRLGSLVGRRYGGELSSTIGILGDAEAGLTLPFVVRQFRSTGADLSYGDLESTAMGDPVIHGKYTFFGDTSTPLAAAALASVSVPIGSGDAYAGRDGFGAQLGFALSYRLTDAIQFAGNFDYVLQPEVENISVPSDDELQMRAGAAVDLPSLPVGFDLTVMHVTSVDSPWGDLRGATGTEILGAVRYAIDSRFVAVAGAGVSASAAFGIPDWRAFAGVRALGLDFFSPSSPLESDPEMSTTLEAGPSSETRSDGETDGGADAEASSRPGNETEESAEDASTETTDGAGENAAGVTGTPAPAMLVSDQDGDGLPDRNDNCPNEPGPEAHNGCSTPQTLILNAGTIEPDAPVSFRNNRAQLTAESQTILRAVAALVVSHPEIETLTVTVQEKGPSNREKKLARRRVSKVKAALVKAGVDSSRFSVSSVPPDTESGASGSEAVRFQVGYRDVDDSP